MERGKHEHMCIGDLILIASHVQAPFKYDASYLFLSCDICVNWLEGEW